jgi:hypothetical protein
MSYSVSPADVAARWRPLDEAETAVALVLLEDAVTLVDVARPLLGLQVTEGVVPERLVIQVLADMVQRVLRNPDVQSSVQLGADGSVGQSFPTATVAVARPRLQLTEYDLATLDAPVASAVATARGGAYSVPLWDL